jgi:hypothetical protein
MKRRRVSGGGEWGIRTGAKDWDGLRESSETDDAFSLPLQRLPVAARVTNRCPGGTDGSFRDSVSPCPGVADSIKFV